MLFSGAALRGDEAVEPEVPPELRFIYDEYMNRMDWEKKVAETPGITKPLYDYLWKCVEGEFDVDIGLVLSALAKRPDLTQEQLKGITNRLRLLAAGSVENLSSDEMNFLLSSVQFLKRQPSPENEDLLLRLLEQDNQSLKSVAAHTLAKIGTRKAVEPMRRFVESRMNQIDPALRAAAIAKRPEDSLLAAQRELLQRVNDDERKADRANKPDFNSDTANGVRRQDPAVLSKTADDGDGKTKWIISIIIGCGITLWLLRSRFGNSDIK